MLLILHIALALASVACSAWSFVSPNYFRVRTSYALTLTTLASGTALVMTTHSPLVQSCVAGLIYTGLVLSLIVSAKSKLGRESIAIKDDK